jgi:hypothetical protein
VLCIKNYPNQTQNMSDDKKVIFSMEKVNKETPTGKLILKDVYLSFYYGAKIGRLYSRISSPRARLG